MKSFYGVLDRWVGPDILYRISVAPDAIYGARVGGGWGLYLGRLAILGELAPVLPIKLTADPQLDAAYRDMDARSTGFLSRDKRNFKLTAARVAQIHITEKGVFGHRWRRATVSFDQRDDGKRLVLHVTPSDLPSIRAAFARTAFRLDADGSAA